MPKGIPNILYHYCSVDTFFNIIKNNSVWLSDIEQSNDSLELAYARNMLSPLIQEALLSYRDVYGKGFTEYDELKWNVAWNCYADDTLKATRVWGFCLSEKGDLLSQWRGYADDGSGFSIGFNRQFLAEAISMLSKQSNMQTLAIKFDKVAYSDKEIKANLLDLMGSLIYGHYESFDEFREQLIRKIAYADMIAPYYKNESFKEEREWRIALTALNDDLGEYINTNCSVNDVSIGNFGYISTRRILISHFELIFNGIGKAIKQIIIGPKCKVSENELRCFLISKGVLNNIHDNSIKISKSSSSYR